MSRINVANFRHPDGTSDNISLDDSGRVLIGTSTAGAFDNRRVTIATSSGTTALELRSASNGDSRIVFTDSTDSGDAGSYKGQILYDQSSDYMSFNTNGNNERMRILSSGGITFNGDTAAANALDDYEEGTWTPTLTTAAGDFGSVTYHGDTGGRYTKIGSRVFLNGTVRLTAFTVGSVGGDAVYIGGLPFTSAQRSSGDNADDIGPLYPTVWTGGASSTKRPTHSQIIHNLTTRLRVNFYNPGSSTAVSLLGNDLGSTINIYISLVYTTSQ